MALTDPIRCASALRARGTVAGVECLSPSPVSCAAAVTALDAALWAAGVDEVDGLVRQGHPGRLVVGAVVLAACRGEVPGPVPGPSATLDDDWLEWWTSAGEWAERHHLAAEEVLVVAGTILVVAGGSFSPVGAVAADLSLAWSADR